MSNFIKPCEGRLTSGFRTKERPSHNGVDFAQTGTVEIKAVANGRVMRSYLSKSYGEVIFILHNIGGQEYETVYAHMRSGSRRFNEGQNVNQGDVIGIMGNTGDSSGQHLHFELHKGRWNINKTNAVNPIPFIEQPAPQPQPAPVQPSTRFIHLPANAATWTVYKLDRPPVKSNPANIAGTLKPAKFGGLKYQILEDLGGWVFVIQTANFGRVKIYGHPSTGAVVK